MFKHYCQLALVLCVASGMSEEVNVITAILLAGFAQSLVLSGFLYNKSKQLKQFKILMLIHLVFALDLFLVFAGQHN